MAERLLPLLALCQSAALIDHVAATGTVDAGAMARLVDSLLGEDVRPPPGAADYPIGAAVLEDMLRGELPANQANVPHYLRAMVKLERKLAREPRLMALLDERLDRTAGFRRHYAREPASVYAALAGVYTDTAGSLRQPFQVTGALRQIASPRNADIIRTAILGGLQAAAAWRRAGGRPWQLRFGRRRLLRELENL